MWLYVSFIYGCGNAGFCARNVSDYCLLFCWQGGSCLIFVLCVVSCFSCCGLLFCFVFAVLLLGIFHVYDLRVFVLDFWALFCFLLWFSYCAFMSSGWSLMEFHVDGGLILLVRLLRFFFNFVDSRVWNCYYLFFCRLLWVMCSEVNSWGSGAFWCVDLSGLLRLGIWLVVPYKSMSRLFGGVSGCLVPVMCAVVWG